MAPLFVLILAPGLIGGIVVSMYLLKAKMSARDHAALDAGAPTSPSDVINIAHIRVAGAGGLGLVIMCVAVAIFVPGVGAAVLLGIALGALLAFALIRRQRDAGPMPSSGQKPGANTMLSLDDFDAPTNDDRTRPARRHDLLSSHAQT